MRTFINRALGKLSKLDIEQVRALLDAVAADNERMAMVLDSLTDGVMVADPKGNVTLSNKAAERLLPLYTDYHERTLSTCLRDTDMASFVADALEREESVRDREFTLDLGGGMNRFLLVSLVPLVRQGAIEGSILMAKDISEMRVNEARLRQAESLASLTTLAAGVAHEIKNPLGSISIHIQLIERALHNLEVADPGVHSYLNVITEEIDRLNGIVVDFLFAIRPMDVDLKDRCLNDVVHDLLEFLKYELEESKIDLVEDLNPDLPLIQLDDKYVKQTILNMVKNSMNAMPNGGKLRLSTDFSAEEVILRVEDSGRGMSPEVMAKIFEPFYTTKDFGSGIGLTLVYKVMKAHRGEIQVTSEEGQGTTFTLRFPIPQKQRHAINWKGEESSHEV